MALYKFRIIIIIINNSGNIRYTATGVDPWMNWGTCPQYFFGVDVKLIATRCQITTFKFT